MICDIKAYDIRTSVISDIDFIKSEVGYIASVLELPLKIDLFTEDTLDETFPEKINEIKIEEDDIVFFFFSGHGYRTENKEDFFPYLYITDLKKGADFSHIITTLQNKNPRFLLALADCCNNIIPEKFAPPLMDRYKCFMSVQNSDIAEYYNTLFLQTKGSILLISASPGELSWASKTGGLFTKALFYSLHQESAYSEVPDWNIILDQACLRIVDRNIGQNPFYLLNIEK